MANNLNKKQRKWALKKYWKYENADVVCTAFFVGVVKNKVYEKSPKTVNELKDYIHVAFIEIDKNRNLCCTVCPRVFWTDIKNVAMPAEDIFST